MNTWTVSGRVGHDPELQVTTNGSAFTKLNVAVTEWDGQKEFTTWVQVITWKSLAERVERFVQKGMVVVCSGRCNMRKYTDKNGVDKLAVELVAFDVVWDMKARKQTADTFEDGGKTYDVPSGADEGEQPAPVEVA